MYQNIDAINLKSNRDKDQVNEFLKRFDLKYEEADYTVVIKDNEEIIATCSKKGNILKCFAIDEKYQGLGLTNSLVSKMNEKLFSEGKYHSFIFTKPQNRFLFEGLGYKNIFTTDKVCLLETGNKNIYSSLEKIKRNYFIDDKEKYAALIMNCNPFTLGHKYLIEKASKENKNVIVFIVEEDKSAFPFDIRFKLVVNGTRDLRNVIVLPASQYLISSVTFPNYFLKKDDDVLEEYTKLDCNIFGKYFAKKFNIVRRYIGTEPNCKVTNVYNQTIQEIMPRYGVKVDTITRLEIDGDVVSASKVRALLKDKNYKEVEKLVPETTFNFLMSNTGEDIIDKL